MALETDTLLLHLENQLQWLQKQRYTYLNLPALSQKASQQLNAGVQTMLGISVSEQSPEKTPSLATANASSKLDDIEALRATYCTCQRCPLSATRTNFVFGTGNVHTPLLFIGEGPGAEEDRLGEPFVGKAGKLLTKMIQAMGVDRPDVYIANVVKCRPPQNRNPQAEEIAKCFPILQRQIALIDPRVIVTLGNVPTRALVPHAPGITKSRGQVYHYQKWAVLPTFHPAYLLRNPSALTLAWDDFRKIMHFCFEKEMASF